MGKRFFRRERPAQWFYLALAVCLVAVGIAAWSTYDAGEQHHRAGKHQLPAGEPAGL